MRKRLLGLVLCAFVAGACQNGTVGSQTPSGPSPAISAVSAGTGVASSTLAAASMAGERPWKAKLTWTVTGIQWAGSPGTATSTFDGRCSVASDYVISATFEGEATHAGLVRGSTSHCSQIVWGPQGPMGATYSDGQGMVTSANGSTLILRYGDGMSGADLATGELWFRDTWTFTGGTGLFEGATGTGEEGGRFADFNALLAGAPVTMWMEGTITYNPNRR